MELTPLVQPGRQVIEHGGVELLLLGLGRRMVPVAAALLPPV